MSDVIEIKGLFGFGYHGLFDDERENGQGFLVDARLELDLSAASRSDLLPDTINYSAVCDLILAQLVGPPVSLIERLAGQIAEVILHEFPKVKSVRVTVHKPDAPVAVKVKDISVSIERTR
ncbi:MAG TPA: dihydroneopterin aldolase [Candidatus Nanopelagicaceae bacterium]|jgi:dihydroneopterin aldolase